MDVLNINLKTVIKKKLFHLAIGNFDGVHLGHQKIIRELVKNANEDKKFITKLKDTITKIDTFKRTFEHEIYEDIEDPNIESDIENLRFNTSISQLMILNNEIIFVDIM